jgi:hypothetical protein
VEGQIGWFRRNHLVLVPDVPSVQALNAMTGEWDAADEARRIGSRARTVAEFLAIERPLLRPLPEEPFETGRWFTPRVDRFAQVTVRTSKYSVPARLIGRRVRVLLHASDLVIYDGHAEAARHERLPGKSSARLDLDHYLEALVRKPGALPGSTALGAGPRRREVHPGPRGLVGRRPQGSRRRRRHPGAGGGPAAAPAHGRRARRCRAGRRAAGRGADRRCGRAGGPQGSRRVR